MKQFRPRLEPTDAWERLIDLAREKSPEFLLSELSDNPKIEWNNEEKSITSESQRIKTLDQLLDVAKVDLDIYDVERHIVNSWEVTSWKRGYPETRTNYQVKAYLRNRWFDKIDTETIQQIIDTNSGLLPKIGIRDSQIGKPLVCMIADLHCGAWTKDMKLVPDYNVSKLKQKLHRLSQILKVKDRPVHLKILGDLIESYSGKNHKDTWMQIEQHGMRVMFTVADMLIRLINETPNIESVDIISGNHDRISSANDEDTEGQVAYAVAELIKRSGFENINYDPLLLSSNIDGVQYILTHGHLPISKKNPSQLVLDYGCQNSYNVLAKAHRHTEAVEESTTKLRVQQCPSFVPANNFAERLGEHSPTGFLLMEANELGSVNVNSIAI